MLARGDADVAISHAPAAEAAALAAHGDWLYRKVMFNDFVIVGPYDDPAKVRGVRDAVDAFRQIARAGAPFVSRGDQSGTHEREQALWSEGGVQPTARLLTSGAGMAVTLRAASSQRAYTLTDRPTFLRLRDKLELHIIHEGDVRLVNTYAVLVAPGPKQHDAMRFAEWLVSGGGRELIRDYRVGGTTRGLNVWPTDCSATTPSANPCVSR
jgi:tungstate transport system substrate-binding protein